MAILVRKRSVVPRRPSPDRGEVLRVEPGDDLEALAPRLVGASRVEVNFPKFGDGRGYSIARLLRDKYGYRGEIRAVGVVARDLLAGMEACGFDAFLLREGEDADEALGAFADFGARYQRSYR